MVPMARLRSFESLYRVGVTRIAHRFVNHKPGPNTWKIQQPFSSTNRLTSWHNSLFSFPFQNLNGGTPASRVTSSMILAVLHDVTQSLLAIDHLLTDDSVCPVHKNGWSGSLHIRPTVRKKSAQAVNVP
jgi:hypothetical protein